MKQSKKLKRKRERRIFDWEQTIKGKADQKAFKKPGSNK